MRVFLDTNIVIDFFDQRPNFYDAAAQIMARAYNKEIEVVISATSVINSFYILRKAYDIDSLKLAFIKIFGFCDIAGISKESIVASLNAGSKDFEDTVQMATASEIAADYIITRDAKHFDGCPIPVLNPVDFLRTLA